MADKSLSYRFLGKDDGLGSTMAGLGKKSDSLHLSLGKLAGAFSGALVGAKAVDLLRDSISNASDLSESVSKTRVVFGAASKGVEAFAATAATSIGQSKQEALEATSTFGNLFRALGIGAQPAANLSTKIVKLAGDLASFNNTDPAEALDALKSGLLGEAEPLRKYGVTLSAVRVQAEALADGIVKPVKDSAKVRTALLNVEVATRKLAEAQKAHGGNSLAVEVATKRLSETQKKYGKDSLEAKVAGDKLAQAQAAVSKVQKDSGPHSLAAKIAADNLARANAALAKVTKGAVPELTAAQKAQASYNIIMKDTKTAQGDFARTSGGLANQQRILKAEFKDASAQLGTKLLPVATKLVTKMTDALKPGSQFRDVLGELGDRAKDFSDDAKPIFTWIGDHPHMFSQIAKDAAVFGAVMKAKSFLTGMGLLKGLTGGGGLGGAAGALAGVKSPIPVFVTNSGGLPGTGTGGGLPTGVPGGKGGVPPVVVPSTVGLGVVGVGLGTVPDTRDATKMPLGKLTEGQNKAFQGILAHGSKGLSKLSDADIAAIANFIATSKPKDAKTRRDLSRSADVIRTEQDRRGYQSDRYLDDPKRGRAGRNDVTDFNRGVVRGSYAQPVTKGDLAHLLTPGMKPSVQNYYITVNGLTIDQALAEAHRRSRVHALGSTNTPASRDRRG